MHTINSALGHLFIAKGGVLYSIGCAPPFSVGCGSAAANRPLKARSAFLHPALKPEITCPKCTGSRSLTKRMP